MITLENDKLRFSFPELADELRQLTAAELERVINHLMSENRTRAFARLVATDSRYSSLNEAVRSELQAKLLALTPDMLRQAILGNMHRHSFLDSNNKSGPTTTISFQRTLRIPKAPIPTPASTKPSHNVSLQWTLMIHFGRTQIEPRLSPKNRLIFGY